MQQLTTKTKYIHIKIKFLISSLSKPVVNSAQINNINKL